RPAVVSEQAVERDGVHGLLALPLRGGDRLSAPGGSALLVLVLLLLLEAAARHLQRGWLRHHARFPLREGAGVRRLHGDPPLPDVTGPRLPARGRGWALDQSGPHRRGAELPGGAGGGGGRVPGTHGVHGVAGADVVDRGAGVGDLLRALGGRDADARG